jgi:DNA-binding MarR family transcriptional regulator
VDRQADQASSTDTEILECVGQLMAHVLAAAERIAARLAVPVFFLKALRMLDCPMAMKELGRRMHCDPSFVTSVADMLEKRGLAARQPHPADRRIKNLVLTARGSRLRQRVEDELAAAMPWAHCLTAAEREQFLYLLRKMSAAPLEEVTPAGVATPARGRPALAATAVTASPAARVTASPAARVTASPPPTPGGGR